MKVSELAMGDEQAGEREAGDRLRRGRAVSRNGRALSSRHWKSQEQKSRLGKAKSTLLSRRTFDSSSEQNLELAL
jgi:hypothetical protein